MAADDLDTRVARLQEDLLAPTAEDYLARAEQQLAEDGEPARSRARHSLHLAMVARERESQLRLLLDGTGAGSRRLRLQRLAGLVPHR